MRKTKYEKVTIEKEVIAEICCNKCGRNINFVNLSNLMPEQEGHFETSIDWGYHSPFDGEAHSFDLCIECYEEFVRSFKIPVAIKSYL